VSETYRSLTTGRPIVFDDDNAYDAWKDEEIDLYGTPWREHRNPWLEDEDRYNL